MAQHFPVDIAIKLRILKIMVLNSSDNDDDNNDT